MIRNTMKSQLIGGLTACLLIVGLVAPAVMTAWLIWQKHLEFVNMQSLVAYSPEATPGSLPPEMVFSSTTGYSELTCSTTARNHAREAVSPLFDPHRLASMLLSVVVIMPLSFCLGMVFYRQYHLYQMITFKEQVANLEKLWRQEHC